MQAINTTAAQHDLDAYVPALHPTAADVLGARGTEQVFALNSDYSLASGSTHEDCFAIARPVARTEYARLKPGQLLLYTEIYTFQEGDDNPGSTALVSHLGELQLFDEKRGLFYAFTRKFDSVLDLSAEELYDVWVVTRLVSVK